MSRTALLIDKLVTQAQKVQQMSQKNPEAYQKQLDRLEELKALVLDKCAEPYSYASDNVFAPGYD